VLVKLACSDLIQFQKYDELLYLKLTETISHLQLYNQLLIFVLLLTMYINGYLYVQKMYS
jgi:hypothetical protein